MPVGELALGVAAAGAVVEVSQGLFEDPCGLQVEGVVGVEGGLEALPGLLGEPFGGLLLLARQSGQRKALREFLREWAEEAGPPEAEEVAAMRSRYFAS